MFSQITLIALSLSSSVISRMVHCVIMRKQSTEVENLVTTWLIMTTVNKHSTSGQFSQGRAVVGGRHRIIVRGLNRLALQFTQYLFKTDIRKTSKGGF